MDILKVGDKVKIIDSLGCGRGKSGDFGRITSIGAGDLSNHSITAAIISVLLLTGEDKGHVAGRYHFRYEKANEDWDD